MGLSVGKFKILEDLHGHDHLYGLRRSAVCFLSVHTDHHQRTWVFFDARAALDSLPYAVAVVVAITIGFIADRTRQRGLCNICIAFLGIVGFSMLLGKMNLRSSAILC